MLEINFIKPHWQCIDDNCSEVGDYARGYCRNCYNVNYRRGTLKGWSRFLPNKYILENDYLKIALYDRKGKIKDWALIDIEDYEKCKDIKWTKESSGYVINAKVGRLHHFILNHE